ncbi:exodeoxyribonuclease VII large subunit [Phaeobacter sp. PT47_59]|uniref:exodeoxyribonuclease VII large subunit n=1 Tax=Phaeobacter sp. PT47_59 TaxID=3029979 RepID=UPI0023808A3E|nr:exodeoxyribonuclease VII large subunit [Phaeobacter sp. PT47_59]MDE4173484.1 exodeoxyribonuclease VII large subunit [Phaeobacter sp. PT47_59]
MSDLIDDPAPGQNAPEFTVSEISGEVKRTLESTFGRIRVRGEVGRVFKARSGHLYYDVKDDRSVLACTTWKGQVAGLSVVPEEGLEVVVTGRLTAFGAQSKYNMNVEEVAVAGQGALMALLEKRKKQLEAEGLFAPERKKQLPYLPQIIGVVTSPSGAVIRDILHRLRDRFPRKVLVWPVAVQGSNCAPEVARAIEGFNRLTPGGALPRPDLIIVARGGGSIEDLWGFNEEIVARAAAASDIPLISAVGHETDTTLIDFVSDRRAPTPTAAAELAVPVRLDLLAWSENQGARLARAAGQAVQQRRQRLNDLSRALPRPETLLETPRQRLDQASDGLPRALTSVVQRRRVQLSEASAALRPSTLRQLVEGRKDRLRNLSSRLTLRPIQQDMQRQKERIAQLGQRLDAVQRQRLERQRQQLSAAGRQLEILSYKATLARGYAVVRAGDMVVTTRAAAQQAGPLQIEFSDGRLDLGAASAPAAAVGPEGPKPKPKPRAKPKTGPDEGGQGSLF